MRKFETIDSVTTDIMESIDLDPQGRGYKKMVNIVLRALTHFGYNIMPTVKSEVLTVLENGTVNYPSDAFKVKNVGLVMSDGSAALLGRLNESPLDPDLPAECSCDACGGVAVTQETSTSYTCCTNSVFVNCYDNGYYYGEMYGYKEDRFPHGRYFDNQDEMRIEFSSQVQPGSKVVVKYKLAEDKYTHKLVPVDIYQLLRTYVCHQWFQASNMNKSLMFNRLHRKELRLFKKRKDTHSLWDFIDAITGARSNAPR